jgi:hypothetical protein
MKPGSRFILALAAAVLLRSGVASAEPFVVRHVEGLVHGFYSLRSPEGVVLASGDLIQDVRGDRVSSRLVLHFEDGSLHEESAVFSQRGHFQLISHHLVQNGPAFKRPLDMMIDCPTGHVIVRYKDENGEAEVEDEHMELPPDLANGLIPILLKNVQHDGLPSVSVVAPTPKPRLVKVIIGVVGTDSFSIGGSTRKAMHYVLKIDIGGVAGFLAPLMGKQPPDSHVWISEGEAPIFLRSQAPMFIGGPVWQLDLVGPVWPAR